MRSRGCSARRRRRARATAGRPRSGPRFRHLRPPGPGGGRHGRLIDRGRGETLLQRGDSEAEVVGRLGGGREKARTGRAARASFPAAGSGPAASTSTRTGPRATPSRSTRIGSPPSGRSRCPFRNADRFLSGWGRPALGGACYNVLVRSGRRCPADRPASGNQSGNLCVESTHERPFRRFPLCRPRAPSQPPVRHRRRAVPGPRHRGQHGDLHADLPDHAAGPAGPRSRAAW